MLHADEHTLTVSSQPKHTGLSIPPEGQNLCLQAMRQWPHTGAVELFRVHIHILENTQTETYRVAVNVTGRIRLEHEKKRRRAFSIAMWPSITGCNPHTRRSWFLYFSPVVRGPASSRECVEPLQEYRRAQVLLVSLANVVSVRAGP